MSYQAFEAVFDRSHQRGSALLLLLAIARHADKDGRNAYPGVKRLAEMTRLKHAMVKRLLKRLLESGELVIQQRHAPGRSTRYAIILPGLAESEQVYGSSPEQGYPRSPEQGYSGEATGLLRYPEQGYSGATYKRQRSERNGHSGSERGSKKLAAYGRTLVKGGEHGRPRSA